MTVPAAAAGQTFAASSLTNYLHYTDGTPALADDKFMFGDETSTGRSPIHSCCGAWFPGLPSFLLNRATER